MALTPELDGLAAKVASLDALINALDGIQPIQITIGTYNMLVDPSSSPEAYARGVDVLRSVAHSAILDVRNVIATTAIAQSQASA